MLRRQGSREDVVVYWSSRHLHPVGKLGVGSPCTVNILALLLVVVMFFFCMQESKAIWPGD